MLRHLQQPVGGASINDIIHLGGSEDQPKGYVTPKSLFSKMGDKGKGGIKNLKKWVTSFMDNPLEQQHHALGPAIIFPASLFCPRGQPRCQKAVR